jgi:TatA/E family protein of Tat protein translocase
MFGIGPLELVMILVVALLVFGPKRVPELARTIGRGLAEFRRASNDLRESLALDDLKRDVRQSLDTTNTIHRPGDRPAQAGDDLATAPKESSEKQHPGELPLDNDHEHHDESHDEHHEDAHGDEPTSAAQPTSPERDSPPAPKPTTNTPADSDLGNIPVDGSKPTDSQRG